MAKRNIKSGLTDQQLLFCREYLIDLNQTQAAIRAKYSEDTATEQGSRLLTNVKVYREIQRLMDERSAETKLSANMVLDGIMEVIERCKQGVAVLDKEGKPTGEWKFEAQAALKGYELLGKHLKLFSDKLELSGDKNNPIAVSHSTMTEEQVDEKIRVLLEKRKNKFQHDV